MSRRSLANSPESTPTLTSILHAVPVRGGEKQLSLLAEVGPPGRQARGRGLSGGGTGAAPKVSPGYGCGRGAAQEMSPGCCCDCGRRAVPKVSPAGGPKNVPRLRLRFPRLRLGLRPPAGPKSVPRLRLQLRLRPPGRPEKVSPGCGCGCGRRAAQKVYPGCGCGCGRLAAQKVYPDCGCGCGRGAAQKVSPGCGCGSPGCGCGCRAAQTVSTGYGCSCSCGLRLAQKVPTGCGCSCGRRPAQKVYPERSPDV